MGVASIPTAATVGVALVAYLVYSALAGLNKNIEGAKKSGLPYIVSPVSPFSLPAQVTHKLWIPIVRTCLPRSWWENWITHPAPRALPKLVETYEVLKQFGDNTLTTEGPLWRIHRRATAASFNERNAALVFAVAAEQTRGMLDKWMADQEGRSRGPGGGGEGDKKAGSSSASSPGPIRTIDRDTMRLALNIIGYGSEVGQVYELGARGWAYVEFYRYDCDASGEDIVVVGSTAMAVEYLLPLKRTQEAAESYTNYVAYMNELLDEKLQQLRAGNVDDAEPGMDIMGQLVRSTYGDASSTTDDQEKKAAQSAPTASAATMGRLGRPDILGNAFIMLVAGHETTANALHFTLLELAAHPAVQRALQRDLDALLGDRDPGTGRTKRRSTR
ncbi:unnamed protein product [Parascedosporium putredinis]|uniref:Cytochrome P450 n=1 Tax=Parascedosporium putredinis TaxID=1442378 RepID=A0A9P1GYK9_9PEZI|nr:unnamed protein product [Parascedosporium putredinis]CAI7990048.1 unnamed protein product [Parascedosporium putredinis]